MSSKMDLNELFKTAGVKLANPVKKLNLDNNPKALIGMYLVSSDKYEDIIKNNIDKNDVNSNTILFFEDRHLFDIGSILLGTYYYLIESGDLRKHDVTDFVSDLLSAASKKCRYDMLMAIIDDTMYDYNLTNNHLYKRLLYITKNVWFLGYNNIDDLLQEALKVYTKETNNELSDTSNE